MTLHAFQLLFCFPFIHITKTMYGYIFGLWQGLVIGFLWENSMVMIYLFTFAHCSQPVNSLFLNSLIAYVHTWRNGKLFFVFLMAFHISSIPFVTKASLVIYYVVIVVRIYCHTHTHTYTHTHTHTRTHHSQRWLPERELVLLCPCETTIIEREICLLLQSYHHHIRHFMEYITSLEKTFEIHNIYIT